MLAVLSREVLYLGADLVHGIPMLPLARSILQKLNRALHGRASFVVLNHKG